MRGNAVNQIVVSTIGTSLLTNQIDRANADEKQWYGKLRDVANLSRKQTPDEVETIIETLRDRATQKLSTATVSQIRAASAELNGLYGLYENDFSRGQQDHHYLVATDTAQGIITAELVADFLRQQGLSHTSVYTPANLSTASTTAFSEGIDDLIAWLESTIRPLRQKHEVCFNLVGSFKSLQGYMNTLGMFYADKVIYIFEGKDATLITIPRLPIRVDEALLASYTVSLALMDSGLGLTPEAVAGIPEAMVGDCDGQRVLSTWGKLIWDQAKGTLLSQKLLSLPHVSYNDTFRTDYNKLRDTQKKVSLQLALAQLSAALSQTQGDPRGLPNSFKYYPYQGANDIDHFRVTAGLRVSCRRISDGLQLRYYGTHDYVQRKEGV